jgi:hypothetical protein
MENERWRLIVTVPETPKAKDFDELMNRVCALVDESTGDGSSPATHLDVTAAAVGWFLQFFSKGDDADELIDGICTRATELYSAFKDGILPLDRSKWPADSAVRVRFRTHS